MQARAPRILPVGFSQTACRLLGTVLLLYALSPSSVAADKEGWHPVAGDALSVLFSEKEFGDGAHFAYRFRRDGTFSGTEMGKSVSGAWRAHASEFCMKWLQPPGPDECYQVERDGANVRFLINGSEAWYGKLEPLQ